MTIAPTQSDVTTALRAFMLNVLPSGTDIILGQGNLTAEPTAANFCIMTPIRLRRLSTNYDTNADAKFTGSIAAKVMTVTAVQLGAIAAGATLSGVGVAALTTVTAQTGGTPGGAGTYTVSVSQSLAPQTLSAGQKVLEQPVEVCVQIDFHSNDTTSMDMAQTFSTAFRDEYAVLFFSRNSPGVVPLIGDYPHQVPFINDQDQYEWRWVVEAFLQADQSFALPQQYMDQVQIVDVPVDIFYAP